MVPEDAAAQADALQVQRDNEVVKRSPHHAAQLVDDGHGRCVTAARGQQQAGGVGITLRREAPRNRIARHQRLQVTDVAAATQRIAVVAHKQMPRMPGIALLAAQDMPVNTQPAANARAPGHVSAVVDALQRTPAAFGLQCGYAVVFNAQVFEFFAQRRFQHGTGPIIGQTARRTGNAAANIGRGQFNQTRLHHKRAAGRHAHGLNVALADTGFFTSCREHAQNLARHSIRGARFGARLGAPRLQRVPWQTRRRARIAWRQAHGDLGSANIDAGLHAGTR